MEKENRYTAQYPYRESPLENLRLIRERGMEAFLKKRKASGRAQTAVSPLRETHKMRERMKSNMSLMQFLVKAYDGEGLLDKRMEVRPRHLEGMKALGKQVICAGGLLDEQGKMKGSALVMEFPDRAALDAYLKNEPYVVEGVWQKIEVEAMNVVLVNGENRS